MKYLLVSVLAIIPFLLTKGEAKDLKVLKIVEKSNDRDAKNKYSVYNHDYDHYIYDNNVDDEKFDVAYDDPDLTNDRSLSFNFVRPHRNRQKVEHGQFLKTLNYLVKNLRNKRDGSSLKKIVKQLKKRPNHRLKDDSSLEELSDETKEQPPLVIFDKDEDLYYGGIKKEHLRRPLYRLRPPLLRSFADDSGQADERTAPPPPRYVYDNDY